MIRLINGQHIENFSLAGAFLMEGGSVNVEDNRAEDTLLGKWHCLSGRDDHAWLTSYCAWCPIPKL